MLESRKLPKVIYAKAHSYYFEPKGFCVAFEVKTRLRIYIHSHEISDRLEASKALINRVEIDIEIRKTGFLNQKFEVYDMQGKLIGYTFFSQASDGFFDRVAAAYN